MELTCKPDWEAAQDRMDAWWHNAIIDRAVVQVTAPREGLSPEEYAQLVSPGEDVQEIRQLTGWFTDPDEVIPRLERIVEATYWGGEAFPIVFPVSIRLVAILSAYLGCPYSVHPGSNTGWADPIIDDWSTRRTFRFEPDNPWWLKTKALLSAAGQRAEGRYYIGVPDLNGPGEILALLRGTDRLALDLVDEEPETIVSALNEVNKAWLRYWQAATGIIHQWVEGYLFWMGIWSSLPAIDLQNDFSCLISTGMFERFFLPALEEQTQWVQRTIYHLDGPGAIRHLDLLLDLPELDGIQWVPGAGAPSASHWIRLLRRIQARGKLIQLYCEPWEIEVLLTELEPEGLLLSTQTSSEDEARELLSHVPTWTAHKQWVVP